MPVTLGFDVYGTLIDTHGVVSALNGLVGDKAQSFSQTWRDKQLEYAFRRGLMQRYENFAVCTKQALDFTCQVYREDLDDAQKRVLMDRYRTLPAFDDVKPALADLSAAGFRLYAFSNGSADAVETLLSAAGIRERFIGVVSTDDVKSFKPNPAVYRHFLTASGATGGQAWLVSSNPFDVIGAMSAGMRAAWVRRTDEAIFDPWGMPPTATITSLVQLAGAVG